MNPTRRTKLVLSALAALTFTGTACSDPSPGQAVPISRASGISDTRAPTSGSNGGAAALDDLDPCVLVTSAEVDQFGAQPGIRKDTSSGPRTCTWQILGGNGLFSVDLRNRQGLKDVVVNLGTLSDQRVGSHDGKVLKENDGPGACMVIIGITESSRVDVMGFYKTDTAVACDRAMKVAELVEPRLPKGE